MRYMDCEVFPDPRKGDLLGGINGEERMVRLREIFLAICEFLQSGDGLSAVPANEPYHSPRFFRATVDAAETEAKTGLTDIAKVSVGYPENSVAFKDVNTDHVLHFTPLHPIFRVSFRTASSEVHEEWPQEWPEESRSLPFFKKLAELMGTDDLVFGYSVD